MCYLKTWEQVGEPLTAAMYGLSTPLTRTLPDPEFDSISSILAHSGLKQSSPWKSSVDSKGNLFYVELDELKQSENESERSPSCNCYKTNGFPSTLPRSQRTNTGNIQLIQGGTKDSDDHAIVRHAGRLTDYLGLSSNNHFTDTGNNYSSANDGRKFIDKNSAHTHSKLQWSEKFHSPGDIQADHKEPHCTCKSRYVHSGYHTWSSRIPQNNRMERGMTEVYISINSNFALNGCKRHSSLCEKLLGIVPGVLPANCPADLKNNLNVSQKNGSSEKLEGPVLVKGLVPDSSALRCRKIKMGQILLTVNDCKVSWKTLDAVLSELQATRKSNKVKLTLKPIPVHEACAPVLRRRNAHSGQVISHVVRGENSGPLPPGGSVLYLTLDDQETEENKGKEDILYQFPRSSSPIEMIRGAFITLSHTLKDVTDTPTKSSSLLVDSKPVQVCYHVEGRNLLVMTSPGDRQTGLRLEVVLSDMVRLLHLQYSTIDSAFTDPTNHPSLDHLFTLVYQCCMSTVVSPCSTTLSSAQCLPLPENIKERLSTELSSFEAADFADKSDDKYGLRRSYAILGSCVFYKGQLLCSHLPAADLLDIHLLLTYHGLLQAGGVQPVKQLVLWQEVFPSRRCQDVPPRHVFGYSEPDGRWFLLVVGVENSLLCALLETGGCTSRMEGTPGPDCFFIDQTKATLLEVMSSQLVKQCELRLQCGVTPTLSADWFYNGKPNNLQPHTTWSAGLLTQITNPTDTGQMLRSNSLEKTAPATEGVASHTFQRSLSLDSNRPGDITTDGGSRGHLVTRSSDPSGIKSHFLPGHNSRSSVRKESALFHFLHLDSIEGVFISSSPQPQGPVHSQITQNFHQACLSIRKLFCLSKRVQTVLDEDVVPCFGVDVAFDMVEEHGILFQYTPDSSRAMKKSQPLTYWVVGRVFSRPLPRELYVCFHESTPPNLVELAFRLSFGRGAP